MKTTHTPEVTESGVEDLAHHIAQALPGIKVVKGQPDEEELAALVASIVSAKASQTLEQTRSSVWQDPQPRWGLPPTPSASAWRWSAHRL